MAGRLQAAGPARRLLNRTASRADVLVAGGASRCASPHEGCAGAAAAFVMVADDAASRTVWLGPQGALAIERPTLAHDRVLALRTAALERGLRYRDAPVTGLPEQAEAGSGRCSLAHGATTSIAPAPCSRRANAGSFTAVPRAAGPRTR
jgi:3-hydroxyisobutyrate dehydrogenase